LRVQREDAPVNWRYEKDRIELSPFGRLDRSAKRTLDGEAERLAELHRVSPA